MMPEVGLDFSIHAGDLRQGVNIAQDNGLQRFSLVSGALLDRLDRTTEAGIVSLLATSILHLHRRVCPYTI